MVDILFKDPDDLTEILSANVADFVLIWDEDEIDPVKMKKMTFQNLNDQIANPLQTQIDGNDVDISALQQIHTDISEPTGFVNRTDSNISFNEGTEEFTIAPVIDEYEYYIKGVKYTISSSKSLSIAGGGINYFYLDTSENLNVTQVWDVAILRDYAYITAIYWDVTNTKNVYFGDERHGITWDWNHHAYVHLTEGTKYQTGLGLSGVVGNGTFDEIWNGESSLWTFSIIQSFSNDFIESTDQNHTNGGDTSLDFSGSENGDIAQFTKGSFTNLTDYTSLVGWIYITGSWDAGDEIQFYGWDSISDVIVGNSIDLSDYITIGTLNSWQKFTIPLADLGLTGLSLDSFRMEIEASGAAPNGYIDDLKLDYLPSPSDADMTFGVSTGIIRDEDLVHTISEITKGDSNYVVLYRYGASGIWTHDSLTDITFKNFSGGSGRVAYNQYTGATWQQTEVPNDEYCLTHIFATNSVLHPIVAIQGQSIYSDVVAARIGILTEINGLITGDMPFEEFLPIGSLIIRTSDDITNTYNASFTFVNNSNDDWVDFRGFKGASTGNVSISDHGGLSGLNDDDHPQYYNQPRGDARYSQLNHEHDDEYINVNGDSMVGDLEFQKTAHYDNEIDNGNSGSSKTIDWTLGNKQKITVTDDCTLTFTPPAGPCNMVLNITIGGVGGYDFTYPGTVIWPNKVVPELNHVVGAKELLGFYYDGTSYFGTLSPNFGTS